MREDLLVNINKGEKASSDDSFDEEHLQKAKKLFRMTSAYNTLITCPSVAG